MSSAHITSPARAPESTEPVETPTPVTPESAPETPETPEGTGWNFAGRIAFTPGAVNGHNGEILAADWFGRLGDYRHFQAAAAVLGDLTSGDLRLRLGPQLNFEILSGDYSAAGSTTYHVTAGANFEVDWRHFWGRGPIAGPSRIAVDLGLGYGWGTTQAETITLHSQSGIAYALGASLNLINASIGPVEMGLDAYIRWNTVDGPVFNSPTFAIGGALTFRGAIDPAPSVVECSLSRRERLMENYERLSASIEELRTGNARHQEILNILQARLEDRGVTREQLVENLRSAYAEMLMGERAEGRGELAGVSDEMAAQEQAEAAAATRYPDDFDPYAMPEVAATEIPEPLPEDCDALDLLVQQLNDEVAQLNYQKGLMEGTVTGLLIRLGVPAEDSGEMSRLITQFRDIHFITARPYGGTDLPPARLRTLERRAEGRGHQVYLTIEEIVSAVDAYIATAAPGEGGVRPAMPRDQMMEIFASTFPSSLRAPASGSTTPGEAFNPALDTIGALAELLNSEDMRRRGAFVLYIGHTDSRGDDDYNMRLSQRRADALAQATRAFGVDGARIRTMALGETTPTFWYDQATRRGEPHALTAAETALLAEAGVTGAALTDELSGRRVTNRSVEAIVCLPNSEEPRCISVASIPDPSAPPAETGTPPVQAVETSTPTPRDDHRREEPRTDPTPTPTPTPTPNDDLLRSVGGAGGDGTE